MILPREAVKYQGKVADVAELQTINFSRLISQEPVELKKLLHLCQTEGFFYLDLQGLDSSRMLEDLQNLLAVMKRFFDSPLHEKNERGFESQRDGYEAIGTHAGIVEGTRDGYETLKVSRLWAEMSCIVKNEVPTFRNFVAGSSIITRLILASLSNAMGRSGDTRFECFHRDNEPSNTTLVMFRYVPGDLRTDQRVGHQQHTDIGSLTLLFSEQWGLQVQRPGAEAWEFIEPLAGHAVINVGDSLRFASGNKLYSCIHRVVPIDNPEPRYSIAYFLRPEDNVVYKDSNGREIRASDWHDEKYSVFQQDHKAQEASYSVLMGGMQEVLKS
ncbi:2OG-Fe(II) oxygenase family oxidoreductase, putative [Cordyceps militaris CM01]|uniref:2OG-Fe(II) oxygenase family oxidoreductase, putative n=1 Tax=Cordyceps militaris (strain CM01) TaxID=983644 RepID=G3JLC9_CORMM|nr:2OG-Fe(II) oxygenase family oxidoreductase, putative [Cordyceps militaris CM01]EGX90503.1 2OG-Fe(II) oxygenase family oxidoreductase, putative [Cordyceps militaris CM01]